MKAQDGVAWLLHQYANAKASDKPGAKPGDKDKPGAYHTKVYHADVPVDLVLEFDKYENQRRINKVSGRVAGSQLVATEERETLEVPAGTDVCLYRAPNRAGRGETIAVFFLDGLQVTFKFETNLVHRSLSRV